MLRRLALPFEQFAVLKEYCRKREIDFISTPDGKESLQCLVDLEVPLIKIGSAEVTNLPFLQAVARTGKPMILSTGMSTLGDVEKAVNAILETGNDRLQLMHCTTDYPTSIEDVNLRAMVTLREAFHLPVGYSDHTLGFEAAVAAVTLGACCIEKHITLDRNMEGPDHRASMPPEEFRDYVKHVRNTERLLGDGRKRPTENEKNIMQQVRRSILAADDLPAGTVLTPELLCYKRPGNGIDPEFADILIGRKLKRNVSREEVISWEDI
jgi:N-acetylneuraminate synthase/N,N'-diacetyllegionaminate synthase